ncbi:flagellar basal-body MS-ring/collar protein FliF [Asaia spathodeae]|uniref:Flagellar M-ring protein n=1 Tax=Asaia spathodeae TaxID=657016 RepID=A0ABX2P5R5_9PROT|nr:flagellar basal-body MS-ring/collar protein FliF [Asaia spathodeae]GBR20747.1 flagellar MS-ring protein [Asaia spathodeae NBRC 105894]
MNNLLSSLRGLGRTRLIALGAAGVTLLAFLGFLVLGKAQKPTALLYGNLDLSEAARMVEDLDKNHITASTSPDGGSLYVAPDEVAKARLLLAKDGLPNGGSVGYELFDKSATLTSTQFEQNINETRALEGELERSIRLLQGVRNVRVHLVLPHRDLFSVQTNPSQASVVIDIGRAGRIATDGIQAIQNLVAAAVPGLRPQSISIVDTRGDVLAKPGEPNSEDGQEAIFEKFRHSEETRLSQAVEEMLIPTLGTAHIRARAAVVINNDEVHETEESFDPNQQVLRSQQTSSDKSVNTEASPNTSVANNLPNANAGQANRTGSSDTRDEETNNYEIGKRVRVVSQIHPRVARISMAVMVDGSYVQDKKGNATWKPLDQAEIDRITTLVKTAVGYDKARGDQVEVVSMRFMPDGGIEPLPAAPGFFSKDNLLYLAEWVVPILLALGAGFFALRPLLRRGRGGLPALAGGSGPMALEALDRDGLGTTATGMNSLEGGSANSLALHEGNETVAIDGVEGQARAGIIAKVADRIDQSPEGSLSIIRGWLESPELRPGGNS